ncbi:MAG: hypothetical protein LBF26_00780 [Puniceicoccales bacterium]|jgi:FKBP-type peptidyl-prolyl cis-trans isomerase (trigger factor)|nr:hypothetical protein [Puniceicoccales bacterium]
MGKWEAVKIEIGKTEGVRREVKVTASSSEIAAVRKSALDVVRKHVKVPGFRPGKAPDVLILQRAKEEVNREFVLHLRAQAVRHVKIFHGSGDILALVAVIVPNMQEVADGDDVTVTVYVDVSPEFELPDYDHIPIPTFPEPDVSEEEIDEKLREEPPNEEDLKDAQELREHVRRKIYSQKAFEQHEKRLDAITDFLCNSVDFPLPASLVEMETADLLAEDIGLNPSNLPGLDKNEMDRIFQSCMEAVCRRLKRDIILEAIAKREAIAITKDDMLAYLFFHSNAYGIPMDVLLRTLKKDESELRKMRRRCLSRKVIAMLLERSSSGVSHDLSLTNTNTPFQEEDAGNAMLVLKRELRRASTAEENSAELQQADGIGDGPTESCAGPSDAEPTARPNNWVEND